MFNRLLRRFRRFFQKSSTINDEPLNKVSLIVIILIDIFILVNVFIGLDDIGRWYISPYQSHGCYTEWQNYRNSTAPQKEYDVLSQAVLNAQSPDLPGGPPSDPSLQAQYQRWDDEHLGRPSPICLQYAERYDALNTPANQQFVREIDQKQIEIGNLEQANQTIRSQYDSTLLEEIAGQPRDQSINQVEAAEARATLDANTQRIDTLKAEQATLRTQLVMSPEGDRFLAFLNDDGQFRTLEQSYDRASFWYPSIQIVFQGIFLVPLILIAATIHRYAQRRGYGLMALMSWHLLVIFCIPLIVKVFQFLQVGFLFEVLTEVITTLLGGLLFLVSYLYILAIPLIGFGIIKFFQRVVFNPQLQAAGRVQKSRCIRCAKKLKLGDRHCPHCGYSQFVECPNCHAPTYKYLPYCKECGTLQQPSRR